MGIENKGVLGLLGGIGLTGLFPSSIYLSQFIIAYVLYLNYFSYGKEYISFYFIKNKLFDRFLSIILLIFTNRKAFLFPLIFFTIKEVFSSARNIFIFNRIKKLSIGLIALSFILLLTFYFLINTIHVAITPSDILEDIYNRVSIYIKWAINPDKYTYNESAIMNINLTGGKFSYFLTNFLLIISLSFNLRNISKGGIFKLIVAYSYISLILFKESATLFSPSPSSLVLFMVISAILGNNINNKFLQKYQFHN